MLELFFALVFFVVFGLIVYVLYSKSPVKSFYFSVHCLIFSFFFERIPSFLTPIGPIRLGMIFLPYVLLLFFLIKDKIQFTKPKLLQKLLVLLLLLSSISVLQVENFNRFISAFGATLIVFITALVLSFIPIKASQILKIFTTGFVFLVFFSFYQFVGEMLNFPIYLTGIKDMFEAHVFGIPRIHATYNEPAYLANVLFLGISLFALLSLTKIEAFPAFIHSKIKLKNWSMVYFIIFLLLILIFILTIAKSAWLVSAILLVPFLILLIKLGFFKIYKFSLLLLFSSVLICITLMSVFANNVILNITNSVVDTFFGGSATAFERSSFFNSALQTYPKYAITGAGSGQFGTVSSEIIIKELLVKDPMYANTVLKNPDEVSKFITFNVYAEILLEYGILFFLTFVYFFINIFILGVRKLKPNSILSVENILLISFLIYILSSLIQWNFISPLYIAPIFIIIGLTINLIYEKN
jgi:O-antigen ligase